MTSRPEVVYLKHSPVLKYCERMQVNLLDFQIRSRPRGTSYPTPETTLVLSKRKWIKDGRSKRGST